MMFSKIYPLYIAKAEKKGRTKEEVDHILSWLTGYTREQIEEQVASNITFEEFFAAAPELNPNRTLISGSICGVKIAEINDAMTKEVRYLDKLIDELARGKQMEKILR